MKKSFRPLMMSASSQRSNLQVQESYFHASNTMRVAIAGSGGLACAIAHYLATETYHAFIILSRAVNEAPLAAITQTQKVS